jgi:hypothetical protein
MASLKVTYYYNLLKLMGLLVVFALVQLSCERQPPTDSGFDCAYCYQDPPQDGPLLVKVSINSENLFVPITIYIGNIEDNNIEYTDTTWAADYWIDVPVNKYYSVAAKYISGADTIVSVDGDNFKIRKNTNDCDEDCWYYVGGFFDVRLLEK